MASVYKRKEGGWRAVIRMKGYPTVCKTFDRKQEADDWAKETERCIKLGGFNPHSAPAPRGRNKLQGFLSWSVKAGNPKKVT